ncbi:MAG: biotin/lipoyl-containing protein, partial [Myxococcota bacterium]
GRGMRRIEGRDGLESQLEAAKEEAVAAFGDPELILERAITGARHVEVQVFADQHGHVIHLGERDCSVQRRHQKVVEEAPSPAIDAATRERMGAAAVEAARSVGYVGAGTVEFLVDASNAFFFIEMNTRLQVEHPVTELVTGFDLVAWQLDVAAGRALFVEQADVSLDGHAIEVRLYAEDADQGFLPATGTVERFVVPDGEGVRVDHGVVEGGAITSHYDPMVAKIIAKGRDREQARRRLLRALRSTALHGVTTNQAFLIEMLQHGDFVAGRATTDLIGRYLADRPSPEPSASAIALAAVMAVDADRQPYWNSAGASAVPLRLAHGDTVLSVRIAPVGEGFDIVHGEASTRISIEPLTDGLIRFMIDDMTQTAFVTRTDEAVTVTTQGRTHRFERRPASDAAGPGGGEGALKAPMAGKVVAVRAAVDTPVERGDVVVVLEAMKMRLELRAPRSGQLVELNVAEGDQIESRQTLLRID